MKYLSSDTFFNFKKFLFFITFAGLVYSLLKYTKKYDSRYRSTYLFSILYYQNCILFYTGFWYFFNPNSGYFALQSTLFFNVLCDKKSNFALWSALRLNFAGALPDPLCARIFKCSTFAKGRYCKYNSLAYFLLQGFAVCESRAKVGLGVKKFS